VTGPRVLVTGATGLLGPYLMEAASRRGPAMASARCGGDRPCDLTDRAAVEALVREVDPDVVLHATGLTDVDRCEREPSLAYALNRDAAANLAAVLPPGSQLVYISTDQVYPDVPGPHVEGTEDPVNVYGRSKLAGERAALAHRRALVLRTNFFGPSRTPARESLSDFVARNLAAGRPVALFEDVWFSPLHMQTVADLVTAAVEFGLVGVFNLASRDGMSKKEFGLAVARRLGLDTARAAPAKARDIPGRAPRTADLRLDVRLIEAALSRSMPSLIAEIERL
jgi:dTDP-4-dehydrorhamnose reductase